MTVAAFVQQHRALALMPAMAGGLGWTPAVFNVATLTEFAAACSGPEKDHEPDITPADARRAIRMAGMKVYGESSPADAS